jgi:hypothetical protein
LNSSRKKLHIYGLTDEQIKELERTKEVNLTITYYSPVAGTVIEKKVQEGMYINEGMSLFDIADLTSLWNIAEVNESEINVVTVGSNVSLSLQAYPGDIFHGKVSFIYPVINSQTRTVKIRSDFSNTNGKLKPLMFGQASFERSLGNGLVVPADAVLFMGKRNVVWVKVSDGMFEPREVTVGMRINDNYQILSGLNDGDEVAKTGGFLIDSESQLKSGMVTGHQNMDMKSEANESDKNKSSSKTEKPMNMNMNMDKPKENSIIRKGTIDVESIDENKDGKVFQDFMDWNVISDKPGKCPLCKMTLKEATIEIANDNLKKNGYKVK